MRPTTLLALAGIASAAVLPRQDVSPTSSSSSAAPPPPPPPRTALSTPCTNPSTRKEWRTLTDDEKSAYTSAVLCLRTKPARAGYAEPAVVSLLDDLTYTHNMLASQIHFVAGFLPWHRWLLARHEALLRSECGYAGAQPYWDWTLDADADNVAGAPVWDAATGFGGDGVDTGSDVPGYQDCVMDGPFANMTLTLGSGLPQDRDNANRPHCLTRNWNSGRGNDVFGRPAGPGDMRAGTFNSRTMTAIYSLTAFEDFASALERQPHGQVHDAIGGDMSPTTAPNDPIFYMHHANIDRVWAKWQGRDSTRLADFAGYKDQRATTRAAPEDEMPVMQLADRNPVVKDYLDTLAGPLCYQYTGST